MADKSRFHARDRLIVALDVDTLPEAERLLDRLEGEIIWAKLGAQLLTAAGPEAVRAATRRGLRVFYDAKFHDIPRTVGAAVSAACRLGVDLVNVHASGGGEMMAAAAAAARAAARGGKRRARVLAVTVLTSLDRGVLAGELGVRRSVGGQVTALARLARNAGLDGVVASPHEIASLRRTFGRDFIILTPGIRPAGSGRDDQRRIQTPAEAVRAGADYLVVGRPVTGARDPRAAVREILGEIEAVRP